MKFTEIRVNVKRLIALPKYENVSYEVGATVQIQNNESPSKVYEEVLAFCQDKIIKEMERMEAGIPPKRPVNPVYDDEIPF